MKYRYTLDLYIDAHSKKTAYNKIIRMIQRENTKYKIVFEKLTIHDRIKVIKIN